MQLIRFAVQDTVHVGVLCDDGRVRPLPFGSLAQLLRLPLAQLREAVETAAALDSAWGAGDVRLLPPVDGHTEVWAAGVTYERSSEARQEESVVADVYSRVYDADRPELFFKGVAWRAVGHEEPIGIRADSAVDVPEPELALVVSSTGELVGLTICNDVSSRSIEGENPLYLPQAKIYAGSLALGPAVTPIWAVEDVYSLGIRARVLRNGHTAWAGETSTAALHRRLDDLVEHVRRHVDFPDGLLLSTGTGLVPELDFTLCEGDVVEIEVDGIGTLRNEVTCATREAFAWLTPDATRQASEATRRAS